MQEVTATVLDRLIQHRTCEQCHHPLNDQGMTNVDSTDPVDQRGWIHTDTGQYRCPPGTVGTFAFPDYSEDTLESVRDEAYQVGYSTAQECMYSEDQLAERVDEARDEGYRLGRADYSTELNGAITVALHTFIEVLVEPTDIALVMQLNEVLTSAWESVDV